MEWMLTDEDYDRLEYPWKATESYQNEKIVAEAQAKKLVEWGEVQCREPQHECIDQGLSDFARWECITCRDELRRQVGLE